MNNNFFIGKMTGNWIVQSTNYSLLNYYKSTDTFINKVKWHNINSNNNDINNLLFHFNRDYTLHNASLYDVEYIKNGISQRVYYILIYNIKSNPSYILKFNSKFDLINKFTIKDVHENYLFTISKVQNITIVEKIYFLHQNLKVIKSIIKKNNQCIGLSFSSEIRIS